MGALNGPRDASIYPDSGLASSTVLDSRIASSPPAFYPRQESRAALPPLYTRGRNGSRVSKFLGTLERLRCGRFRLPWRPGGSHGPRGRVSLPRGDSRPSSGPGRFQASNGAKSSKATQVRPPAIPRKSGSLTQAPPEAFAIARKRPHLRPMASLSQVTQ